MKSLRMPWIAALAPALLLLSGCITHTVPLEIVSISPEPDEIDVLIDATITVEASAVLDPLTVTPATIQLLRGAAGSETAVACDVAVSASTITITPATTLYFGMRYSVVIAGTVADEKGNLIEGEVSWAFTTRALEISVAASGGMALGGAAITLDGSYMGTTSSAGTLAVTAPSGGSGTLAAQKKFFVPSSGKSVPLDGTGYDARVTLDPYVYVPDFYGAAAPSYKIIRMDSVDADPATYVTITSVDYGAVPTNYPLTGPRWIHVDYDGGIMYVSDAPDAATDTTFIRMTNFPPASDGSEADVVTLTGVRGVQQFHVMDDGRILLMDYRGSTYQSRLVELPADLDIASASFGAYQSNLYFYGIAELPGGEYLIPTGTVWAPGPVTNLFKLDDYADVTPTDFVTDATVGYGNTAPLNPNEFCVPFHVVVDPSGDYVYVGDTGEDGIPTYTNARIARYATDGVSGTDYTAFGTLGQYQNQFYNPILLGILPDNKLYILDFNNQRVVRLDPGIFDTVTAAAWAESDATATFDFNYWYNYS